MCKAISNNLLTAFFFSLVNLFLPNVIYAAEEFSGYYYKGLLFTPVLGMDLSYDDNIFSQDKVTTDSIVSEVSPEMGLGHSNRYFKIDLRGSIKKKTYYSSSNDNYIDNSIRGAVYFNIRDRSKLELNASFDKSHEEKGTGFSQNHRHPIHQKSNRFRYYYASTQFSYGNNKSLGDIRLILSAKAHRIDNNFSISDVVNKDEYGLRAIAFLRSTSGNALFIEPSVMKIDYRSEKSGSSLDNYYYQFYLGVEKFHSRAISGVFKVGLQKKRFEAGDKEESVNFSWSFMASWEPVDYSRFFVKTENKTEDSTGFGDSVEVVLVSTGWKHDFQGKYSLAIGLDVSRHDYNPGDSAEGNILATFSIGYRIRNNITCGVGYNHMQRLSNRPLKDYERNQLVISLKYQTGEY